MPFLQHSHNVMPEDKTVETLGGGGAGRLGGQENALALAQGVCSTRWPIPGVMKGLVSDASDFICAMVLVGDCTTKCFTVQEVQDIKCNDGKTSESQRYRDPNKSIACKVFRCFMSGFVYSLCVCVCVCVCVCSCVFVHVCLFMCLYACMLGRLN